MDFSKDFLQCGFVLRISQCQFKRKNIGKGNNATLYKPAKDKPAREIYCDCPVLVVPMQSYPELYTTIWKTNDNPLYYIHIDEYCAHSKMAVIKIL